MNIYAGFDCGGSSTRCLLADENGNRLGIGRGGPSNYVFIGKDMAADSIKTAVSAAFADAGLEERPINGIFVASAAVEVFAGAAHEDFFKSVTGCEHTKCNSDIFPVWYAGGERGRRFSPVIAMIAGTGAVTYLLKDHTFIKADGWGPTLGDDGSGYSVGLAALKLFSRMADHRMETDSEFYETILDFYEIPADRPRLLLRKIGGEDRYARTASVSRVLEGLYLKGNQTVNGIYRKAAAELAHSCRTVLRQAEGEFRVVLSGGMLRKGTPLQLLLEDELSSCAGIEKIVVPDTEAVVSAASIALMNAGYEDAAEAMMK